ncbi:hypothetical protein [Massilia sp. CCM 8734]|uniref:hypothetical protein n=1 Tax=Massilia sp. CCM 8734 TaxID=2609283 RepID=UPI001422B3D8|nr:hypothetical protein [Massilia sp. CCM 8734]
MSDRPLTRAELAEVYRMRENKPATKVAGVDGWRDPACCVKYLRERIEREQRKRWKK